MQRLPIFRLSARVSRRDSIVHLDVTLEGVRHGRELYIWRKAVFLNVPSIAWLLT